MLVLLLCHYKRIPVVNPVYNFLVLFMVKQVPLLPKKNWNKAPQILRNSKKAQICDGRDNFLRINTPKNGKLL